MKALILNGFSGLITLLVEGVQYTKVNDDIGYYFQTQKGLRQGDLLSPSILT
jgi:hypothetical protein